MSRDTQERPYFDFVSGVCKLFQRCGLSLVKVPVGIHCAKINDVRTAINTGLERGRTEGRSQGLAEGRAEGKAEGRLEVARAMLANGLDKALVAKCAQLSSEELAQLEV